MSVCKSSEKLFTKKVNSFLVSLDISKQESDILRKFEITFRLKFLIVRHLVYLRLFESQTICCDRRKRIFNALVMARNGLLD